MLTRKAGRHGGQPLQAKGFHCAHIPGGQKSGLPPILAEGIAPDLPSPHGSLSGGKLTV